MLCLLWERSENVVHLQEFLFESNVAQRTAGSAEASLQIEVWDENNVRAACQTQSHPPLASSDMWLTDKRQSDGS